MQRLTGTVLIALALALSGCATSNSDLENRVQALESRLDGLDQRVSATETEIDQVSATARASADKADQAAADAKRAADRADEASRKADAMFRTSVSK
jgi:hypothetical protein